MFRKRTLSWILVIAMILSLSAPVLANGIDEIALEDVSETVSEETTQSNESEHQADSISYRACEHQYSYQLQPDSYEATDTTGGYRHYI